MPTVSEQNRPAEVVQATSSRRLKGRFDSPEELITAALALRAQGIRPKQAAPLLGLTVAQVWNIMRPYTKSGAVRKMKPGARGEGVGTRGQVVVRRLGRIEVFTPSEIAELVRWLMYLRLPEQIENTAARLQSLAEAGEKARKKDIECNQPS